jgi:hypothetical protein
MTPRSMLRRRSVLLGGTALGLVLGFGGARAQDESNDGVVPVEFLAIARDDYLAGRVVVDENGWVVSEHEYRALHP